MKHVFTVHSPITFLAAQATIEYLDLKPADVLVLTNNYKIPVQVDYKTAPFLNNLQKSWSQKIKDLNFPAAFDKYISKLTKNDGFKAYIDLMSYNQRILTTHKNCKEISFIEEGNSSYLDQDDLDSVTWDKRNEGFRITGVKNRVLFLLKALKWALRGYNNRLLALPYNFTAYGFMKGIHYYGFSDSSFPNISAPKKTNLQKTIQQSGLIPNLSAQLSFEDAVIWVDGSGGKFTGLPEKIYHDAIDKAIELLDATLSKKEITVKLRPGIKNIDENYLYKAIKKKGYTVNVMPNDLVLEAVFINSKNCLVVGNLSSALFYAKIFGHRSLSIYRLFAENPVTLFDKMPGFWEKVEVLKE